MPDAYKFVLMAILGGLAAIGQFLLKTGMSIAVQKGDANSGQLELLLSGFTSPRIIAGMFVYAAAFTIYLLLLVRLDITRLLPLVTGFSFLFIGLMAWSLLGEPLTGLRILGMTLIAAGVFFVGNF